MSRSLYAAVAAVALSSTLSFAAPFASQPATSSTVPEVSGTYVITIHKFCQNKLTVTYKSGDVESIAYSGSDENLSAGKIVFKQGSKAGAGTAELTGTTLSGSQFLVKQAGSSSGTLGDPLSENTGSDKITFSQTATTISITDSSGTSKYNIYYGKVTSGIVQHAVFAGIDVKGCGEQGIITII